MADSSNFIVGGNNSLSAFLEQVKVTSYNLQKLLNGEEVWFDTIGGKSVLVKFRVGYRSHGMEWVDTLGVKYSTDECCYCKCCCCK